MKARASNLSLPHNFRLPHILYFLFTFISHTATGACTAQSFDYLYSSAAQKFLSRHSLSRHSLRAWNHAQHTFIISPHTSGLAIVRQQPLSSKLVTSFQHEPQVSGSSSAPIPDTSSQSAPLAMAPVKKTPGVPLTVKDLTYRYGVTKDSLKAAHKKRGNIYGKTRQMMDLGTRLMHVIASRGFERAGPLPTEPSQRPMRKRRYSIDVTTQMEVPKPKRIMLSRRKDKVSFEQRIISMDTNSLQVHVGEYAEEETPAVQKEAPMAIPDPCRHPDLGLIEASTAPMDSQDYLSLDGNIISNEGLHYMTSTCPSEEETWMRDESLFMALKILGQEMDCEANAIAITTALNVMAFYYISMYGQNPQDKDLDWVREQFGSARWIFLPINNGMDSLANDSDFHGSHWTLALVDMKAKEVRHYDSVSATRSGNAECAETACKNLLDTLGKEGFKFIEERNCPSQIRHNQADDTGACGPFVYKMTEFLVGELRAVQKAGKEHRFTPRLPGGFGTRDFKKIFNSAEVRERMQASIIQEKAKQTARELAQAHDEAVFLQEDIALPDIPLPEAQMSTSSAARSFRDSGAFDCSILVDKDASGGDGNPPSSPVTAGLNGTPSSPDAEDVDSGDDGYDSAIDGEGESDDDYNPDDDADGKTDDDDDY